ncbi:MAG: mevalonate kinase [Bdellovibrionota bacterium]
MSEQNSTQNPLMSRTKSQVSPSLETTACGKAIITGEHAAVYGAHAVAIPLHQMRFRFNMTQKTMRLGSAPEIHLTLAGHEGSPRLKAVVLHAMELLRIEPFSLDAETHSSLPIGAGLGSSATLCVAVLRALSQAKGLSLPEPLLAQLANELEKSFHGNPSGLDTAVVAFEKAVLFAKNQKIEVLNISSDLTSEFVLIDSNIRASTLAMIRIAEPYFMGSEGDRRIQAFDTIALTTHRALEIGSPDLLAESMNDCGKLLKEAGVVPANIEDMIAKTRALGAPAAKSTGAGGGGVIIGLLPNDLMDRERCYRDIIHAFKGHAVYRVSLR